MEFLKDVIEAIVYYLLIPLLGFGLLYLLYIGIEKAFDKVVCVIKEHKLNSELEEYQKHELYRHFVDFCKLNGYNYFTFTLYERRGLFYEKEIKLHDFNVLVNKYGFESVTIPPDATIHEYISIVNEPYDGHSYEGKKYFYQFYSLIRVHEGEKIWNRSLGNYIELSWGVSLTDDTIIDELFMEKHKDSLIHSIGIFTKCELPRWKASSLVNIVIEDMYSGKAKEDRSEWNTSYFTERFLDKYANKYRNIHDFFYHEILLREFHSDAKITQSKIEIGPKDLDFIENQFTYSINEHVKCKVWFEVEQPQLCWSFSCTISLLYQDDKWLVDNID